MTQTLSRHFAIARRQLRVRRVSQRAVAVVAALLVVATTLTFSFVEPAEALPGGATCGSVSGYDWGNQVGQTPSDYQFNGVDVDVNLLSFPSGSIFTGYAASFGGETGIIYMGLDGSPNGQVLQWEAVFSEPVYDLNFSIFELDRTTGWVDSVEVLLYNGTTNVSASAATTTGSKVSKTSSDPIRFVGTANDALTLDSSATVTYPGAVTRVVFSYIDGAGSSSQLAGVGDLNFCAPEVGAAKRVLSPPTSNGDGTYTVIYRMVYKNLGGVILRDPSMIDNLASSFGTAVALPSSPGQFRAGPATFVSNPAGFVLNPAFNGASNTQLVNPAVGSLAVGSTVEIDLPVTFVPDVSSGTFTGTNQVTVSGDGPANANGVANGTVTDISDDGTDPDPNGNGRSDDAGESTPTVFTITAVPDISIDKTYVGMTDVDSSATTTVGDIYRYEFLVANAGNIGLTGVSVTDPTAGSVSCPATTLAVGASMTCIASLTLTQVHLDAGIVNNTATANGQGGGTPVSASDSESTVVDQISSITISKSLDSDTTGLVAGDTIEYAATITNTGNVTLDPVTVTDTIAASVDCPAVAPLPGGNSFDCTLTYLVTQNDIDNGQVDNVASVSGTDPNGNVRTDTDAERAILEQQPRVTLSKPAPIYSDVDGSGDVTANDTLTYDIVITNSGNVTLHQIVLTDTRTGTVSCPVTSLLPGGTTTCQTIDTISQADINSGQVDNTASVASRSPSNSIVRASDSESYVIARSNSIVLQKSLASYDDNDASGDISVDDTLQYAFVVTNNGNTTLTSVGVSDPTAGPVGCPVATLQPDQAMTCTASTVVTQAQIDAGRILNNANASGTTPTGGSVSDSDSVEIEETQSPAIEVVKSAIGSVDVDGSGDLSAGDQVNYRIRVTNDGDVTLSGLTVDDSLTGAVTNCGAVTLAPGEFTDCAVAYTVLQDDVDTGEIVNIANATANTPLGGTVTDSDGETVTVVQTSNLDFDKAIASNADGDSSGDVSLGDVLTYNLTVTNDGNTTLTNVVVTDNIATNLSCPTDTLTPGEFTVCTADYTVQQSDIDNGSIDNTASVTADPPTGAPLTATASASVLPSQNPSISTTKLIAAVNDLDGSGTTSAGDTITYDVSVVNDGDVTLTVITGDDSLTGPVTCLAATLAPATDTSCQVTYTVTQDDVDSGEVENVVTVSAERPRGDPGDPSDDIVDDDIETLVIAPVSSVTFDKSLASNDDADGDTYVSSGDTLTYSFDVTNTGNLRIATISVDDPIAGTVSCPPGPLNPGATATCTATLAVGTDEANAGEIVNTAELTAFDVNRVELNGTDTVTTPVVTSPSITFDKQDPTNADGDGSGDVTLGDVLTYSLVVTNDGDVTIDSIVVDDPTTGPVECGGVTTLEPGGSITCETTYTVQQSDVDNGTIHNDATVTGLDPEDNPLGLGDSVDVAVNRVVALELDKTFEGFTDTDGDGLIEAGEIANYGFELRNTGSVTINDIEIADSLTGAVDCGLLPTLGPGETLNCSATYPLTQTDIDNGSVTNLALASGTPFGEDPIAIEDTVLATIPTVSALSVDKTLASNADGDGSGDVSLGDVLTYDIEVTNTGNTTLADLLVTDAQADAVSCPVDVLLPGASTTCEATLTVDQDYVDAGTILNTASAAAEAPDGDPAEPADDVVGSGGETVAVPQTAGITIKKTLNTTDSGALEVGETLVFDLVLTNIGNTTLSDVTVTDSITADVTCPTDELGPGLSITCTARYDLTQTDVDNGVVNNTASVSAETPGGDPVDPADDQTDSDDESVVIPQTNAMSVTKTLTGNADGDASGDVSVGDILSYTVVVTNDGTTTLTDLAVDDSIIGSLTCDVTTLDPDGAGDTATCTGDYEVTQTDVNNGTVDNRATGRAEAPGGDVGDPDDDVTDFDDHEESISRISTLTVEKALSSNDDADGSSTVSIDDTLTFAITIRNTGNTTLTDLVVSDSLSPTVTCDVDTLLPGQVADCEADYQVTQQDVDDGTFDNTASAAAEAPGGDTGDPADDITGSDTATTAVPQTRSMVVAKALTDNADEDGSLSITVDDTLEFTITVTNDGNTTLTDLAVEDSLTGTLTCSPLILAPGDSATCVTNYQVVQADVDAGGFDNTADAVAEGPGGDPADTDDDVTGPDTEAVTIDRTSTFTVDKQLASNDDEDASSTVSTGDTLRYTIEVANTGNTTLTNISVIDSLTGPVSCPSDTLAPDTSVVCDVAYEVQVSDVDAGGIDNTADVRLDGPGGDSADPADDLIGSDTESVGVAQNPSLVVAKALTDNADEDGSASVTVDDTLEFTIVVTNDGNTTLTDLAVDDSLTGAVACDVDSLAPGQEATCVTNYVVTQADVDAGGFDNVASATAESPGGDPADPADDVTGGDTATTPINRTSTISVVKSFDIGDPALFGDADSSGTVSEGDTLVFDIVVTNTGNTTLTDVAVTDSITALVTCSADELAPGDSADCTATYVVDQDDVDAGQIDNTASVAAEAPGGDLADPLDDVTASDDETVAVAQTFGITMTKTLNRFENNDLDPAVSLGDVLIYDLLVTNTGSTTLSDLVVVDSITSDVTCPATELDGTASMTCVARYEVDQADVDAGEVENTATVRGETPGGDPLDTGDDQTDSDTETVVIPQRSALSMTKTLVPGLPGDDVAPVGDVSRGDTLTFEIVVNNNGNTTLTDLVVTDSITTDVTCPDDELAPGASTTCLAVYEVEQDDVDTGQIDNTAWAVAERHGGDSADPADDITGSDTESVAVPQTSALSVAKSLTDNADEDGSLSVTVDDTLEFTIVVSNTGNTTLTDLAVDDSLTGAVVCDVDELAPGEDATCITSYLVTQADVDAGGFDNVGSATAEGPGGDPVDPADDVTGSDTATTPIVRASTISLVKSFDTGDPASFGDADSSGTVSEGDTLVFDIVVTNTGDTTLTDVAVTDSITALVSCSAGELAPGADATCTATYVVDQDDVDAGRIDNTASVTAEAPGGDPADPADDVSGSDTESVDVPQLPGLSVAKSLTGNADEDGSGTVSVDDTLEFTIVVSNTGNTTLTDIAVDDSLTGVVSCDVDALAPGATATCVTNYVASQNDVDAGGFDNTASVSAEGPGGDPADPADDITGESTASTPIDRISAISLTKSFTSGATVDFGDTVMFDIVVANTGNTTLTGIAVTDSITADVSCPLNQLAPGETVDCTATYLVDQDDVDAGQIYNIATVVAQGHQGDVDDTDDETVTVAQRNEIAVTKEFVANADEDASNDVTLGDTLTYRITVNNDGTTTLNSVDVVDTLTGAVACIAPDLAPGATSFCDVAYVVDQVDVDTGRVDNTANVSAEGPGGDPADPADDVTASDLETVTVERDSAMTVDKSLAGNNDIDGSSTVSEGDTLTYNIVITNTGTTTITNVSLSDSITNDVTCDSGPIVPGDARTCTARYVVDLDDVNAGQFDNTATVTADAPDRALTETDAASVDVPQFPSMNLVKTLTNNDDIDGSSTVSEGDTLTYTIVVTNDGNTTLADLVVDDLKTAAVSCDLDELAPGAVATCTTDYVVTLADVDAGRFDNTATATAEGPGGDPADAADDVLADGGASVPISQNLASAVTKTLTNNDDADGDSAVSEGDTLTYEIVVTNTGNATLSSITAADSITTDVTCPTNSIEPTESLTCLATYVVTQADVDRGEIFNQVTTSAEGPLGDPADPADDVPGSADHTETIPQNPSISVAKSLGGNADQDSTGSISLGDRLTYDIEVTNDGDVTINSLVVTDSITVDVTCPASTIAVGDSVTCEAVYFVDQDDVDRGEILNLASANGEGPLGDLADTADDAIDSDDLTTAVPQISTIEVNKTYLGNDDEDGSGTQTDGDTLRYRITVTNTGNTTLTSLVVDDSLTGDSETGDVVCDVTTLAPGEVATCTTGYQVNQDDVDSTRVDNRADASAEAPGGDPADPADDVTGTDSESVGVPHHIVLTVNKTYVSNDDEDGSTTVTLGDTLNYSVTVTNDGTATISNLTVDDSLTGIIACDTDTLAPGSTATCTTAYQVDQHDVDRGIVNNTAVASADSPTGDPADPTDDFTGNDSAEVAVAQNPALVVTKTLEANADKDGSTDVSLDDTLTYLIVVENTGTVTLDTITVTDSLTGDVTCDDASIAPGDSTDCRTDYVVTQGDVDAGVINNVADVTAEGPLGDPLNPADDATGTDNHEVVVAQTDEMLVEKTLTGNADEDSSGDLSSGDTIEYSIVITNTGTTTLDSLTATDSLTGDLTCDVVTLAPGEAATCLTYYQVDQADMDRGEILNEASARAESPAGDPLDDSDDVTGNTSLLTPIAQAPALGVAKSLVDYTDHDGSDTFTVGDTASYEIAVTNTGNTTLTDLVVDDSLTGVVACDTTELAVGQSTVCRTTYVVTLDDAERGSVVNTATATARSPFDLLTTGDSTATSPVAQSPAPVVEVDKRLTNHLDHNGDALVTAGDELVYTITVSNVGSVAVTDLVVDDSLTGVLDCSVNLAAGESTTCITTYRVTSADVARGSITNVAAVSGQGNGYLLSVSDSVQTPAPQPQSPTANPTGIPTTLAFTGSSVGLLVLAGTIMLSSGFGMTLAPRRRRRSS